MKITVLCMGKVRWDKKKNMAQVRSISKAMTRARHGERGKDRDKKNIERKNWSGMLNWFIWLDRLVDVLL